MRIFLYGPPGAGKSTVGRRLAGDLELPFVDMDQVIESRAGASIPQIIQAGGEDAFRDLESLTLKEIAGGAESVVALGGGALLRPENRALAENSGRVILLRASEETLLARLQAEPGARPLLAGDLRERLSSLLANRRQHYASFPLRLDANQPPPQIARQIQIALGRFRLRAMGRYDVIIREGGLEQLGETLRARGLLTPMLVTDETVARFHAERALDSLRRAGFDPGLIVVPAGESHKTLETVRRLWQGFLEAGLDRKSTVIALGGGVIGDLAGFTASTFMRGIRWVVVPTTLLAMVDASLGGKTGFDLPEGKNLIGSFHPPQLVLADPQTLNTLPEAEVRSGFAEVVKHAVIADPALFALCRRGFENLRQNLDEVARRAASVKIGIVEEDPYERGLRAVLNYGHTIGHAVELVSGFRLRHGEAVAIGMVAEARYAERIGMAKAGTSDAIAGVLASLGLPIEIPNELPREAILRAMRVDKKKNARSIRFALPAEIGRVELAEVMTLEEVVGKW